MASVPPIVFPALAVASLLMSLGVLGLLVRAHMRISRLMLGRSGASLEESLVTLARRTKDLETFEAEAKQYLKSAESRLATSIRGVATVRFNPFHGDGSGGNQSFSTAFLSERGDGFVISTLYSRDRVSVFGKPVAKGISPFELTGEEKEVIRLAQENAARR